jgi:hypothetical protein
MIEITFNDQGKLVEQIAADLVGSHPSCWDLVLPPGFGEERFAEALAHRLRADPRSPRVSARGADHSNATIRAFVNALHRDWSETTAPPKPLSKIADQYLDLLLAEMGGKERPLILILKRFHKVLDSLNKWVLGKLRTEEQARRLHTVIITPLPLTALKKRWEARRHYFSTSDYGDSRHVTETAKPPTPDEVAGNCTALEIPDSVVDFALRLTGGYPESLAAVLEWWDKRGRPDLKPRNRAQMLELARDQLSVFVEWLDPLEDGQYRDHVINLYHGVDTDKAREAFTIHPWEHVILEDGGLRAEALGAAALKAALADTGRGTGRRSPWQDVPGRARLLYQRRQYAAAVQALKGADPARLTAHDRLLWAHAAVMRATHGAEGDEHLGEDTDCRALREALRDVRKVLAESDLGLSASDQRKIEGRYEQLEGVADAICAAAAVEGPFRGRLVDILAGFGPEKDCNTRGAALLLLVKFEAGKAIAGDASACQFALSLPEQIFRIWALWKIGISYYDAPATDDPAWEIVEAEWPAVRERVRRAVQHGHFPSFFAFAYFVLARARLLSTGNPAGVEMTFNQLASDLSTYERVRTGSAHGIYLTSKRDRDRYFDLIDRWLTTLIAACPEKVSREELMELIEPLPLVNSDGIVLW